MPEVARALCHQMGYQNPTEIPDQQRFRQIVLEQQIEMEINVPSFVADRCAIDCWTLWQRWQICSAMTFDSENYYDRCKRQSESYTHVIYIPPMFTPPEDAFRWTEPDYVKQMDRLTRLTLYDWKLLERTLTIETDVLENRVGVIIDWLNNA